MNKFLQFIKSLLLVKEIISKNGVVYFRRYRLLQTPWFGIYVHQILKSDQERHPHDHPFSYSSLILSGAYHEDVWYSPDFKKRLSQSYYQGDVVEHSKLDFHKISLLTKEVWTLVFASGRTRTWGYLLKDGSWIDHKEYRKLKNDGKL